MRIGIDTWLVNDRATGIGVYARELARALATLDGGIGLFLYGGEPGASNPNVVLRPAGGSKAWHYAAALPRALRRDRVSVFHAVANFLAPLAPPCPLVVTVHDLIPLTLPDTVSRRHHWLARLLLPLVLRRADRIICVSHFTATELTARFPDFAAKTRVVWNGVQPLPATPDDIARVRRKYELPERYVLTVGALEPRKNLAMLVDAWQRASGALPLLVVAGQRWYQAASISGTFDTASRRGWIRAIGFVEDADLGAVMKGAALFVFPSRAEGFGLPPIEAMSCGVPVVASNAGALPEVLGDGAVLLPPDDPDAWRETVSRLLGDSIEREKLSVRGRAVASRYGTERFARETLAVYIEAVDSARPL